MFFSKNEEKIISNLYNNLNTSLPMLALKQMNRNSHF